MITDSSLLLAIIVFVSLIWIGYRLAVFLLKAVCHLFIIGSILILLFFKPSAVMAMLINESAMKLSRTSRPVIHIGRSGCSTCSHWLIEEREELDVLF